MLAQEKVDNGEDTGMAAMSRSEREKFLAAVHVGGPVVAIEQETAQPDRESMARRYFDGEALAGYLKAIEGSRIVTIRMRPQRWNSSDQS
ncbi:MAG TPA: hypothetical protein VK735_09630 [Pseudonocardia sp.]|jgi:hypothetical protein|uniref:hypothetical protein n=1 Tax=Pseudonocardia sp. TaxID=60912 RepID=UPI002B900995|nr:hypothetical protein [Pseudonocardia sp.]HTF47696.1 hypothetical protein [Pseudonocardia sp.]